MSLGWLLDLNEFYDLLNRRGWHPAFIKVTADVLYSRTGTETHPPRLHADFLNVTSFFVHIERLSPMLDVAPTSVPNSRTSIHLYDQKLG